MLSRSTVKLLMLALLSGSAAAGVNYTDSWVDPSFAVTASPTNWRRIYTSGFVDERGIAAAPTPDGGLVTLISVPGGAVGSLIGLVRYGPDGALYSNLFGNSGKVIKEGQLVDLRAVLVDSQGRIVVVGTTPGPGGAKDFGVLRFRPDGSDDTSFGNGGRVAVGMEPVADISDDQPVAVVEQKFADGRTRLVIAGNILLTTESGQAQTTGMIGLRENGSIDPDFGAYIGAAYAGRTTSRFADGRAAYAAALVKRPNNTLLIAGTDVLSGTDTDFGACYFSSSGVPFTNGCASFAIDEPGPGGSIYDGASAAVQTSADTFALAGNASGRMAAVKIKLVGSALEMDTSFVGSGIPSRPNRFVSPAANTYVNDVAVRSDGSLLLGGRMTISGAMNGAVTRLRRDGSLDTTGLFSFTGLASFRAPTLSNNPSYATEITKILIDKGKPLLFGSSPDSTSAATDYDGFAVRLRSDLIFASGMQ